MHCCLQCRASISKHTMCTLKTASVLPCEGSKWHVFLFYLEQLKTHLFCIVSNQNGVHLALFAFLNLCPGGVQHGKFTFTGNRKFQQWKKGSACLKGSLLVNNQEKPRGSSSQEGNEHKEWGGVCAANRFASNQSGNAIYKQNEQTTEVNVG